MLRPSDRSLANLSASATIVLFTPVISPAGSPKATNQVPPSTDPFETLGRALSRHHRRVRHVPYLPAVGFTNTHEAFLDQADAVIVVIAEPDTLQHHGLARQVDFAEAVQDGLEDGRIFNERLLSLIQCGDPKGGFWPDLSQFANVLKCRALDADMAQQISRKLFEPGK